MLHSTELSFEVVDSHIHIFSNVQRCQNLSWLSTTHALNFPHSYKEYEASGTPASAAVFVECDTRTGTDYENIFEEITDASNDDRIKAIVTWAPVDSPARLITFLDRLSDFDTRRIVRGVRMLLQDKPDGFCLNEQFIMGIQYIGSRGLLFEVGIDVHKRGILQLAETAQLIKRCVGTQFVIDHLAKPDLRREPTDDYLKWMNVIATYPNVAMKLSGCLTELEEGATLPSRSLSSYIRVNLETFGPERLLFGSDWPVLKLSEASHSVGKTPKGWFDCCYEELHGLGLSDVNLTLIFSTNTKRLYSID